MSLTVSRFVCGLYCAHGEVSDTEEYYKGGIRVVSCDRQQRGVLLLFTFDAASFYPSASCTATPSKTSKIFSMALKGLNATHSLRHRHPLNFESTSELAAQTYDRNARLSAASVTRNLSLLIANPDSPFFVKQIKKTHRYLWQDGTVSRIENKIWWEFALVDIERAFARSYVYSLMGNKLISSVSEFGWIKFYLLFEGILLWVYLRCVNMNKQLFSFTEGSILPENLRMFIHVSFLFNSWLMCS